MRFAALKKHGITAAIICVILAAMSSPAWAARSKAPDKPPVGAPAEGLSAEPTKEEVIVRPGQETTFSLAVTNKTAQDMAVVLSAWNFARAENGAIYQISAKDAKKFRGAAKWMRFTKRPVIVKKGERTSYTIAIDVPENAAPGTHSAYLKIIGAPTVKDKQTITVRFVINALMLPIVISKSHSRVPLLKTNVKVLGLTVGKKIYTSFPVNLAAKLRNDGNVHQNFDGAFEVWQGKVRLERIPIKQTLLPEQISTLLAGVNELPYPGHLSARLTGAAFLAKSNRQQKLKAAVDFWYIPMVFFYVVAGLLFFIMAIVSLFIMRLRGKRRAEKDIPESA